MKRYRIIEDFRYDEHMLKWFWFVVETLVSAFVGALIAFVFGDNYWAALATFGILVLFLVFLSAFFILIENRVSILSIMNQGLKDGRYEDVIKFGSALRLTLFTSNKNEDIVRLGYKIDEAALKIQTAHYNKSKGDYLVTIDGKQKSITEIRIGLLIDDLGWSMHLSKRTDEAVSNIVEGIKQARSEALRLSRINKENNDVITPFVNLILRGYRHLCGIYFEDVSQHWKAIFYENVSKLIMSNCKIVTYGSLCNDGKGVPLGTTCGLFCSLGFEAKVGCSRKNILRLYSNVDSGDGEPSHFNAESIRDFLQISHAQGNFLMNTAEIEEDIKLFDKLPSKRKQSMTQEHCYAWGRNIVKKIQNGMYKQGEYDFMSDQELSGLIAEARAFSQVYYYGFDIEIKEDYDFDSVIKNVLGDKSQLRYASLMTEIELVSLLLPSTGTQMGVDELGRNIKIERLIDNLKSTREISRDKRADLYIRASIHLITAYYYEYNLNYRYLTNSAADKSLEGRKKRLNHYIKMIDKLYKEIKEYERKYNSDLEMQYNAVIQDLKGVRKELKRKYTISLLRDESDIFVNKFMAIDSSEYQEHMRLNYINSAVHEFSEDVIERVKAKWSNQ